MPRPKKVKEESYNLSPQATFGERLWQLRHTNRWTLKDVSTRTGVATSTLSKIENGLVTISFETLMKICDGLDLSVDHILQKKQDSFHKGVRTVTRKGSGIPLQTKNYDFEVLSGEISKKGMLPTIVHVKANSLKEFREMNHHPGEEFIYVLRGSIELITDLYEPTILHEGDSAHYDSSMGHAFINTGKKDAVLLSVSHDNTGSIRGVTAHLASET